MCNKYKTGQDTHSKNIKQRIDNQKTATKLALSPFI